MWTLPVLAVLTIGYLGVGLFVAARLSAPINQPQELTPTEAGLYYREVSVQSTDGLSPHTIPIHKRILSHHVRTIPQRQTVTLCILQAHRCKSMGSMRRIFPGGIIQSINL